MKRVDIRVTEDKLAHWAENEAETLETQGLCGGRGVARRTARQLESIRAAALRLSSQAEKGLWNQAGGRNGPPPAVEWLLDNRYLIEREGMDALAQLKRARELPASAGRQPVLYLLMEALVRSGGGEVTPGRIEAFLEGAQRVRALSEREIWLVTPMLKAALVSHALEGCREIPVPRQSGRGGLESTEMAAAAAKLAAVVTSLRMLSVTELTRLLRRSSVMERLLGKDPAGVYSRMDEETRSRYRQELSRAARRGGLTEAKAAQRVLELCQSAKLEAERHVGYYILEKPLGEGRGRTGSLYFVFLALLTALGAGLLGGLAGDWKVSVLLALPISEAAKAVCDYAALRLRRPRVMPKLELKEGLPEGCETLCVTAVLLTDEKSAMAQVARMENSYHLSRDAGPRLCFGLLADLPDAKTAKKGGDRRLLERVQTGIHELNRRYGGGFYLFLRDRRYNVRDGLFMGWERKRGALMELAALLRGQTEPEPGRLYAATGDSGRLRGIQYVITLDADTQLTPGAVRELVGAMAHPLNAPSADPKRGVITRGYGMLMPRMAVDLESAGRSLFSRVFAGQGGLDPYGGLAGEVYFDLFAEASFTGKGIFHVDAYRAALDGRLPQNRVLSHDLLEGSYLRVGLVGDVELIDGYPFKVSAWFDRLHRWTRGDWQIAAWLGRTVPADGKRESNPLGGLSKWKIFDNLRRSLVPIFLLAALTPALLWPEAGAGRFAPAAAIAVLVCLLSPLLLSSADLAFRGAIGRRERHHGTIITGFRAALLQVALQFVFLPYAAWVSASAAVTALWRLSVSKRYLLRWVTAAQSERGRETAAGLFRKMFPAVVWGTLTAVFAANGFGWACGLLWMALPLAAARISRPDGVKQSSLNDGDRAFLCRQAALMWRYFEDLLRAEDHYLPPDNWQEQPAAGIAHRTSPTNIGLCLLCCLTALDLHLCSPERALFLIFRILETIENLPKWHGHLLNWVDTRTLEPLRPRCISTVDSGNLVGCLIALRQGLLELDAPEAAALAERAAALADATDFRPLFDEERQLFSICYDMEKNELSEGYYDLLASEARQTAYIAVARGEVGRRAWKRLGRSLVSDDGYRGMASWTGTMFEYFMPHLLLPVPANSLISESLSFALRLQKRRGERIGAPWGISESCFYAFDPALNYQYKAHGVPGLAFKRGLGKEQVISPYSTFLALLTEPAGAVANLRRLAALGMEGRYGLYEAADYTPSRQTGRQGQEETRSSRCEIVRCFMSHHIGMSLMAADNALRENIWQARFMRDPRMGAYAALLQERAPAGVTALRSVGREVPDKPARILSEGLRREIQTPDPSYPVCHILSNTAYTLICTDFGASASSCAGVALTLMEPESSRESGVRLYFRSGGVPEPLLPMSGGRPEEYRTIFEGGRALWMRRSERFLSELTVCVPGDENAELRVIRLTNTGAERLEGEIVCYFEPVLQREEDYRAHPAFSKLFIETQELDNGVLFRRRARGEHRERFLAFCCDRNGAYETSREAALGRGGAAALEAVLSGRHGSADHENKRNGSEGSFGTVLDPCLLARVPVTIAPGESAEIRFSLSYSAGEDDAVSAARRCLNIRELPSAGRIDGVARLLSMTQSEAVAALEKMGGLIYPRMTAAEPLGGLSLGQRGLWKFGLSGDLPILVFRAPDAADLERLPGLIRQHRFLTLCGYACDMAVLSRDGGDYRRPVRSAVMEALKTAGAEGTLSARGGVHIVDLTVLTEGEEELLLGAACVDCAEEIPPLPWTPRPYRAESRFETDLSPEVRRGEHGEMSFRTDRGLPPLAWGHVLANPSFGCLLTECGPGLSWRGNARENKLTRWSNDPLSAAGAETLRLRTGGRDFSVFAAPDGLGCDVTYGFGWARWRKRDGPVTVTTTAFVPRTRMARVIILEIQGAADAELLYEAELLLGGGERQRRMIRVTQDGSGQIEARNPYAADFAPQTYHLAASVPPRLLEAGAGTLRARLYPVRRGGKMRLVLVNGCSRNMKGAELLRALADDHEASVVLSETEEYWRRLVGGKHPQTGDETLDRYLDGWALYQVIACRMFARASQYQCGGAYGFRDQLQDACAAAYADPTLLRVQILRACAHQYEEGDVQHWWHPGQNPPGHGDKGVRTRVTDDLLWLPYAVCELLDQTGERDILRQTVPFITSAPLEEGRHDRYEQPRRTSARASVYEHCIRAVEAFQARGQGTHGLPLIGTGDWNDGFDKVGAGGAGESVWLAWFGALVLRRMAPYCEEMGDALRAEDYRYWAKRLIQAGAAAWDGEWFRRGYYDDGSTLGSKQDEECRIDSLSQSFAAYFADELPEGYVRTALESAYRMLTDNTSRVVRLFTPPFEHSAKNPGYIKGYVAGVRENGGQYTHAAVWLAQGFFLLGDRERGEELMRRLMPGGRDASVYKAEPYVLAADVYGAPGHLGRGGWSWYTGAASWYYRVAAEHMAPTETGTRKTCGGDSPKSAELP